MDEKEPENPDLDSALLGLIFEARKDTTDLVQALFALNLVGLMLLVEAEVLTRSQIVARLQEFYDATPEERRKGPQGLLLRQAMSMFQSDEPRPDPRKLWKVIDGGLSPREKGRKPPQ